MAVGTRKSNKRQKCSTTVPVQETTKPCVHVPQKNTFEAEGVDEANKDVNLELRKKFHLAMDAKVRVQETTKPCVHVPEKNPVKAKDVDGKEKHVNMEVSGTLEECLKVIGDDDFSKHSVVTGDGSFGDFLKALPSRISLGPTMTEYEKLTSRAMVNLYKNMDRTNRINLCEKVMAGLKDKGIYYFLIVKLLNNEERMKLTIPEGITGWKMILTADPTNVYAKIKKRFSDRVNMHLKYEIKQKKKISHDSSLGESIVKRFNYHDPPWYFEDTATCEYTGEEIHILPRLRSANTQNQPSTFAGNFSVINALGDPFQIGILHCSHRGPTVNQDVTKQLVHYGSSSLVQVPANCMIIFHANLYHYGARSQFNAYTFLNNVRTFTYMAAKGTVLPIVEEIGTDAQSTWCKMECEECKNVMKDLKEYRCDGNHVWKYNSEDSVDKMYHGQYIMGDIETLGWVIVRGYNCEGEDLVGFVKDFQGLIGKTKPFDGWTVVQQGEHNIMHREFFIASGPYAELFKAGKRSGKRMMRAKKSMGKEMEKYKHMSKWFDESLKVASEYVRLNTILEATYAFIDTNVLANEGAVSEQRLHTDYPRIWSHCWAVPKKIPDSTKNSVHKKKHTHLKSMLPKYRYIYFQVK